MSPAVSAMTVFLVMALAGACLAAFPRQGWELKYWPKGWRFKDPDAVQPADGVLGLYRVVGFVVMCVFLGLATLTVVVVFFGPETAAERHDRCERQLGELSRIEDEAALRRRAQELGLRVRRVDDYGYWSHLDVYDDGGKLGELHLVTSRTYICTSRRGPSD